MPGAPPTNFIQARHLQRKARPLLVNLPLRHVSDGGPDEFVTEYARSRKAGLLLLTWLSFFLKTRISRVGLKPFRRILI
jgi:hypothetical protein